MQNNPKINSHLIITFIILVSCNNPGSNHLPLVDEEGNYPVIVKAGFENNSITKSWMNAIKTRQSKNYIDSLSRVIKPLTGEENDWFELIKSRTNYWGQIKDSLKVPFGDIFINDTTFVLLGYQGRDDGFTYKFQTVCFDLTALYNAYGSAKDSINTNRMDRLFAHEYTHLLSKEWARQNDLVPIGFRDSILWECIYEGIGMYRSMSSRWFPVGDSLSNVSSQIFESLYPIFAERIITIDTLKNFSEVDKIRLNRHLSYGPMTQKWGALPVAVWLALEARGNDKNLVPWINKGPEAVIPLAKKYLSGESKINFEKHFGALENNDL